MHARYRDAMAMGGLTLQEPAYTSLIRICGARGDTVGSVKYGAINYIFYILLVVLNRSMASLCIHFHPPNAQYVYSRFTSFLIQRPRAFAC